MRTRKDGLETPVTLANEAEKALKLRREGQEFWEAAKDVAEDDPTLDGCADYVLVGYIRGLASTMSQVNRMQAERWAVESHRQKNALPQRKQFLLALLDTVVSGGGVTYTASVAPIEFWSGPYIEEREARSAGELAHAALASDVIVPKLQQHAKQTIGELPRAEQYAIAEEWASLKRGNSSGAA